MCRLWDVKMQLSRCCDCKCVLSIEATLQAQSPVKNGLRVRAWLKVAQKPMDATYETKSGEFNVQFLAFYSDAASLCNITEQCLSALYWHSWRKVRQDKTFEWQAWIQSQELQCSPRHGMQEVHAVCSEELQSLRQVLIEACRLGWLSLDPRVAAESPIHDWSNGFWCFWSACNHFLSEYKKR